MIHCIGVRKSLISLVTVEAALVLHFCECVYAWFKGLKPYVIALRKLSFLNVE